jgi:imidazolonepropionase-like amidohydrolase
MRLPAKLIITMAAIVGMWRTSALSQERKYITPPNQVVAIRAGRLFDSRSGSLLNNQVILIKGERITEVGAGLPIPREATVIDLSASTVLPGMIDAHVHVNTGGETTAQRTPIATANAQIDLNAGFTTVADMDSRGGFNTVDLRDAINAGRIQGAPNAGCAPIDQSSGGELLSR